MLKQLDTWHQSKLGYAVFGVVELLISYGFVSLAIDRGNLLWYLLALLFLIGALRNLSLLIGADTHGNRRR